MTSELSSARVIARRAEQEKNAALAEAAVREQMLQSQLADARGAEQTLSKGLKLKATEVASLQQRITALEKSKDADRADRAELVLLQKAHTQAIAEQNLLEERVKGTQLELHSYRDKVSHLEDERAVQVERLQTALDAATLRAKEKAAAVVAGVRLIGLAPHSTGPRTAAGCRRGSTTPRSPAAASPWRGTG